jgi:tetratricopeptide (TPR) repeat protein
MKRLDYLLDLLAQNNDPFLLFAIAKEHEKAQDEEQALSYYERVRKEFPDYVGLYYHLGKLFERLQQTEKAMEAYQQGIALARKIGDQHALGELNSALMLIED